jgi:hypothetical protein
VPEQPRRVKRCIRVFCASDAAPPVVQQHSTAGRVIAACAGVQTGLLHLLALLSLYLQMFILPSVACSIVIMYIIHMW